MDKLYAIQIVEIYTDTILTKADSLETALKKADNAYNNHEVILDYDNFSETKIIPSPNWSNGLFTGCESTKNLYKLI